MWFIYILLCRDNSLYTGITNNTKQRFLEHRNGKGGRYTRSHRPTRIVYTEKAGSKSDALKRELQIKSWPRTIKIKRLNLSI